MRDTQGVILQRLCQIEVELSDLHYANKHGNGSFDVDGNRRRRLSEEHVFLSRQYESQECATHRE